jgi:hypothetical protein
MSRRTKAQEQERAEAIARLRQWIKPGDTVYTILDHVSSSGMSRAIRVVVPTITYAYDTEHAQPLDVVHGTPTGVDFIHPNHAIGVVLGLKHWRRNGREQDALVVGGCGMDMGFHLVYELSYALYGDGYACLGKGKCPSSYHNNHRDTIQCPGTVVYNPDGPNMGDPCYFRSGTGWVIPTTADDPARIGPIDSEWLRICPTCNGKGRLPNPEGPERFDLTHTDGYALRHRWL